MEMLDLFLGYKLYGDTYITRDKRGNIIDSKKVHFDEQNRVVDEAGEVFYCPDEIAEQTKRNGKLYIKAKEGLRTIHITKELPIMVEFSSADIDVDSINSYPALIPLLPKYAMWDTDTLDKCPNILYGFAGGPLQNSNYTYLYSNEYVSKVRKRIDKYADYLYDNAKKHGFLNILLQMTKAWELCFSDIFKLEYNEEGYETLREIIAFLHDNDMSLATDYRASKEYIIDCLFGGDYPRITALITNKERRLRIHTHDIDKEQLYNVSINEQIYAYMTYRELGELELASRVYNAILTNPHKEKLSSTTAYDFSSVYGFKELRKFINATSNFDMDAYAKFLECLRDGNESEDKQIAIRRIYVYDDEDKLVDIRIKRKFSRLEFQQEFVTQVFQMFENQLEIIDIMLDYHCCLGDVDTVAMLIDLGAIFSKKRIDFLTGNTREPVIHFKDRYMKLEIYNPEYRPTISLNTMKCYKMAMDSIGQTLAPCKLEILDNFEFYNSDNLKKYVFDYIDSKNIDMYEIVLTAITSQHTSIIGALATNGAIDEELCANIIENHMDILDNETRLALLDNIQQNTDAKGVGGFDFLDINNVDTEWKYFNRKDGIVLTKYLGRDKLIDIPDKIDGKKVLNFDEVSLFGDEANAFVGVASNNIALLIILSNMLGKQKYDGRYYIFTSLQENAVSKGDIIYEAIDAGVTDDGFLWSYNGKIARLHQYFGDESTVKIPNMIGDYKVEEICMDFCKENNMLEVVHIPNNVRYIEAFAFQDCENLTEIYFYGSNKIVDYAAFESCTNVNKVQVAKEQEGPLYRPANIAKEIVFEEGTRISNYRRLPYCMAMQTFRMSSTLIETNKYISYAIDKLKDISEIHWSDSIPVIDLSELLTSEKSLTIYVGAGVREVIGNDKCKNVLIKVRGNQKIKCTYFSEANIVYENH